MDTRRAPEHAHTKHTQAVPYTRPAHGHRLPLQAAEAPTPVSHPQVWPGCPSPPSFPASDAPPREAQPLGSPTSSLRPDKVLERSREAAPALRKVGETGGGARSPTPLLLSPDSQLWTRGVWTGVSASVSLPHAGDTLRTCAYLAWEAPRGAPSASPDLLAPLAPPGYRWGGSAGYPACPPSRLLSVGSKETPSRAAGSYPGPGARSERPLVPGPGRGSLAPAPAACATSSATCRP